ncbi:hypothetical protein [Peribacillus simplex]|nr:hypothetical protein [Peribacillus simplex]WHZ00406.1 hypothetical protein QNH37_11730 [Peribacillus simplex]
MNLEEEFQKDIQGLKSIAERHGLHDFSWFGFTSNLLDVYPQV